MMPLLLASRNVRKTSVIAALYRRHNSTKPTTASKSSKWQTFLPSATMGFAFIGYLQWKHLQEDPHQSSTTALPSSVSPTLLEKNSLATERQLLAIKMFPYRLASRLWGTVHDITLPMSMREPMYNLWTYVFNCNLSEMKDPLSSYKNLSEFFTRKLKDDARPIDRTSQFILTSPVDGKIMSVGYADVSSCSETPLLEQIKGVRYRLDEFLGQNITNKKKDNSSKKLFHIVLYLAPGDYHRIHSPIDWSVTERRHFPGTLFPVSKAAVQFVPKLFTLNERVALLGDWKYGFFSLTAVGATNVGSIEINIDPECHTNVSGQGKLTGSCLKKVYDRQHLVTRGDEVGKFNLGSTVVLVFEAPEDFEFTIGAGDVVKMGTGIGKCVSASDVTSTFPTTAKVLVSATTPVPVSKTEGGGGGYMMQLSRSLSKVMGDAMNKSNGTDKSEGDNIRECFKGLGSAYDKPSKRNE